MNKTNSILFVVITVIGLSSPMAVVADESKIEFKIKSKDLLTRQLHTRSLAASCAACHGTNGNSVGDAAKLAGKDKADFATKMLAFKSGESAATVMHHHAKGLNDQELTDLAEYFFIQPTHQSAIPASQNLSATHPN